MNSEFRASCAETAAASDLGRGGVTGRRGDAEMNRLVEAGVTPVIVSDDDRDHQGTVYDKPGADSQFEMFATP